MQYFVSAEKTPYFYWQLELLIYSFKRFNLEDSLVIGLAESDEGGSKAPKYLSKCRYMVHENFGKSFGYSPLNKIYSVEMARSLGILKPPFAIIDPDMLMLLPILCDYEEDVIGNFSWAMDLENLNKNHQDKYEYVKKYENFWKPIGPIMLIKKDSKDLYRDTMQICLEMVTTLKFWWPIEMLAWICGFCKNQMTIKTSKVFESYIHSNYESNFIHYCHSKDFIDQISYQDKNLHLFDKHQYKNLPKEVLAFEPYYDIIKSNFISTNMSKMKKITKEFLENY